MITPTIDQGNEPTQKAGTVAVERLSDTQETSPPPPPSYRWRPSIWRIRPVLGLFALAVAILCMLVSLAILSASNGETVVNWYFPPTVYLAIATAVSNTALQCALALASPISWWYKALRGSSIKELEIDYEAGQSFPRAFAKSMKYRQYPSLFGIASLATALVLVDGPLLQRSSLVARATVQQNATLNISLAPELPPGFSAKLTRNGLSFTPTAIAIGDAHVRNVPIKSTATCNGTCVTKVRGPGLALDNCQSQTWPISENMLRDPLSTWGQPFEPSQLPTAQQPILISYVGPTVFCPSGREPQWITTGFAEYQNCEGQFTLRNCTFFPAVVEYDVEVKDSTIDLISPSETPAVIAIANDSCVLDPDFYHQYMAIGGLSMYMEPYLKSNASLGRWGAGNRRGSGNKRRVETINLDTFDAFSMKYFEVQPGDDTCTVVTHDPMNDIITSLNRLLFRAGILAASWPNITRLIEPGLSVHQVVPSRLTREENVFKSDIRWFLGAVAIQITTIVLILPAYWGWWTIGVELTLSPFQMAKVFNAPVFKGINSAAGATGVVDEAGAKILKLGVVDADNLSRGACDGNESHDIVSHARLGLDEAHRVWRPPKGARFTV